MSGETPLDTCGCCEGVQWLTPVTIQNTPGLSELSWRVGTHARFKQSMQVSLGREPVLRALTTRDDDDPTIALTDAWAAALDVLTFYQERYANENYLRTAKERRSILELARAIGYELAPGVSASTWLAFTLETAVGAPKRVRIPAGTKAQSIPGQDQKPQMYETSDDLDAHANWSQLLAKTTVPSGPNPGDKQIYLKGVATNLRTGDVLLVASHDRIHTRTTGPWAMVKVVKADQVGAVGPAKSYTLVTLDTALPDLGAKKPRVFALRQRASIFGAGAPAWRALSDATKADYLGYAETHHLTHAQRKEWPGWSIYSPHGGHGLERRAMTVGTTAQIVAAAAKSAASRAATDALYRASSSAQTAAAHTGAAITNVANAAQTSVQGVLDVLSTGVQPMAMMMMSAVQPIDVTGNFVNALKNGNFQDAANALNAGLDDAKQASTEAVQSKFDALSSAARLAANSGLPLWQASGANAGAAVKATLTAARHSAAAIGAREAAVAIEAAIDGVMSGIGGPADIQKLEDAINGVGGAVVATADQANALLMVAGVGAVAGTAAAGLVAGGILASEADADESAYASIPVTEDDVGQLRNVTGMQNLSSEVGMRMLKLTRGSSSDGAAQVRSAVMQAVATAKQSSEVWHTVFKLPLLFPHRIDLDQVYPGVTTGGWLVLAKGQQRDIFHIRRAFETGRAQFLLSGKVTRVGLRGGNLATFEPHVRETVVYAQSEELEIAEKPRTEPHSGKTFIVEAKVPHLPPGRLVSALGTDFDTGELAGEVAVVDSVSPAGGGTTAITFTAPLAHRYQPDSLIFNANTVGATHGETTRKQMPNGLQFTDVLGSGDGSQAFQKFTLKQKPLTYVSAATPSGRATSLEVRVDGVLWREVSAFYGWGPEARIYIVRHGDDGTVTVQFGDGKTGARLPTGQENVTALYRVGIGLDGLVDARQITLLMSRPAGLKEVINPEASEGAQDPEQVEDARRNAPLTVLTLDRVVSLQDYEDFARAFAGIGKAAVTLLWSGENESVHLTIGLADGSAPTDNAQTLSNLRAAIDAARHGIRPVIVQGYAARPFAISAKIATDPQFVADDVLFRVRAALLAAFDFSQRDFGQDVTDAAVIAAIQAVKGVVYVDLDSLAFTDGSPSLAGRLEARPAHFDGATVQPADLLTLAAADLHLTAIAP